MAKTNRQLSKIAANVILKRMAYPSTDWRSLYPFASHYLEVAPKVRMHYVDEGPRDAEPIVFVHGNPTWSFYWRHLVQSLGDRWRCIAVDHVGCGLSDKPQNYEYTLGAHIENLRKLVGHLQLENITLAVHDWGGAIGLGAAVHEPERFSRLVIFNTGAFPPPYFPWRIRLCRFPLLGTAAMRGLNIFARAALSMATNQPQKFTPPVREGYLAPYNSWANRVAIDRFVRDIPSSPRFRNWQVLASIEDGLKSLARLPVLIIWGMKDWCFDERCLERFLDHFPDAETHRLNDAGHYVVEDSRETIGPLVRNFLERASNA